MAAHPGTNPPALMKRKQDRQHVVRVKLQLVVRPDILAGCMDAHVASSTPTCLEGMHATKANMSEFNPSDTSTLTDITMRCKTGSEIPFVVVGCGFVIRDLRRSVNNLQLGRVRCNPHCRSPLLRPLSCHGLLQTPEVLTLI
jgi:hypothetical protein